MRPIDADELKKKWVFSGRSGTPYRDEIDKAPTIDVTHWIPVSERLPEDKKETYWVCTNTGYQCECRWTDRNVFYSYLKSDWHWNIFDIPQYTKVTAWMPLPEPYEEVVE